MLYLVLKRTVERGGYNVVDIQNKLDVFFAADRITQTQYTELSGLIGAD